MFEKSLENKLNLTYNNTIKLNSWRCRLKIGTLQKADEILILNIKKKGS